MAARDGERERSSVECGHRRRRDRAQRSPNGSRRREAAAAAAGGEDDDKKALLVACTTYSPSAVFRVRLIFASLVFLFLSSRPHPYSPPEESSSDLEFLFAPLTFIRQVLCRVSGAEPPPGTPRAHLPSLPLGLSTRVSFYLPPQLSSPLSLSVSRQ